MTRIESVDGPVSKTLLPLGAALAVLLTGLIGAASLAGRVVDQGQIAFESDRSGHWNLYLLDVGTTATVPLTGGTGDAHWPAWSPDGQQLAYNSGTQGMASGELFIMDTGGRSSRQITHSDGNHWHPAWSPDGRQLAFMFNFQSMRLIKTDGSGERGIGAGFNPTWSPDGQSILYYDDQGRRANTDLYAMTRDGKRIRTLTTLTANDWSPVWSPDGRWIAFVSSRGGQAWADLYLIDATCTRAPDAAATCEASIRRLTFVNGSVSSPAWSADSQRVAYVVTTSDAASLYVINLDGSSARRLTGAGQAQSPAWRPVTAAG